MKITKSMVYEKSEEARELTLYCENCERLYHQKIMPVVRMLAKKIKKGTFDKEKAKIAFYGVATAGAKIYCKEYANEDYCYGYVFNVTARWTTACELLNSFMELIEEEVVKNENHKI